MWGGGGGEGGRLFVVGGGEWVFFSLIFCDSNETKFKSKSKIFLRRNKGHRLIVDNECSIPQAFLLLLLLFIIIES